MQGCPRGCHEPAPRVPHEGHRTEADGESPRLEELDDAVEVVARLGRRWRRPTRARGIDQVAPEPVEDRHHVGAGVVGRQTRSALHPDERLIAVAQGLPLDDGPVGECRQPLELDREERCTGVHDVTSCDAAGLALQDLPAPRCASRRSPASGATATARTASRSSGMSAYESPNAASTSPPAASAATAAAFASPFWSVLPARRSPPRREPRAASRAPRPPRSASRTRPRAAGTPPSRGSAGRRDMPHVPPPRLPSPHRSPPVVGRATGGAPRPTRPSRPGVPRAVTQQACLVRHPPDPERLPVEPPRLGEHDPWQPDGDEPPGRGRRVVLPDPSQHGSPRVRGEGAVHVADDDGRAHAPTLRHRAYGSGRHRCGRDASDTVRPRRVVARSPAARARTGRWSVTGRVRSARWPPAPRA